MKMKGWNMQNTKWKNEFAKMQMYKLKINDNRLEWSKIEKQT